MFNMPQTEFLFLVPKTYSASLLYLRYKVTIHCPLPLYTMKQPPSSSLSNLKVFALQTDERSGNFTLDIPVFKPVIETIELYLRKKIV